MNKIGFVILHYNVINETINCVNSIMQHIDTPAYNIVIGSDNTSDYNKYWTSNVVGSLLRYSWCYWLDNTGTVVYDYDVSGRNDNNLRTQEYYMRNCSRDVEPAN